MVCLQSFPSAGRRPRSLRAPLRLFRQHFEALVFSSYFQHLLGFWTSDIDSRSFQFRRIDDQFFDRSNVMPSGESQSVRRSTRSRAAKWIAAACCTTARRHCSWKLSRLPPPKQKSAPWQPLAVALPRAPIFQRTYDDAGSANCDWTLSTTSSSSRSDAREIRLSPRQDVAIVGGTGAPAAHMLIG